MMATQTKTRSMTADDLLRLPRDAQRRELIRGELITMSPVARTHSKLALWIGAHLLNHVNDNDLGEAHVELGFVLSTDPDTVRAADVAFISRERVERIERGGEVRGYWPGAPDLAIEVISPNDRYTEVEEKVLEWLSAGARMVIVVNPRSKTVRVHRSPTDMVCLIEDDTMDGADVVPGWRLPVREIFRTSRR